MALSDHKTTLAFHMSRPLAMLRDMSGTRLSRVTAAVKKYEANNAGGTSAVPEAEALLFYGMNHVVAEARARFEMYEPLPSAVNDLVDSYYSQLSASAVRAFYYLLLICTREARHNMSLSSDAVQIKKHFGPEVFDFFSSIKGGEAEIHKKLLVSPPDTTLGVYTNALKWVFYNSKWNGGYGGPAWGAVATCLHRFVTGEFSAEMMLDTNWTLAHNNGPIFNKGIFYSMYSAHLVRVLDVQRSGQIPTAIVHDAALAQFTSVELKTAMVKAGVALPGLVKPYVDWYVVEALGSVKKYPSDKSKQLATYGESDAVKAALKKEAEIKAAAAAKAAELELEAQKAAALKAETEFVIMPGVVVKKFKRVA